MTFLNGASIYVSEPSNNNRFSIGRCINLIYIWLLLILNCLNCLMNGFITYVRSFQVGSILTLFGYKSYPRSWQLKNFHSMRLGTWMRIISTGSILITFNGSCETAIISIWNSILLIGIVIRWIDRFCISNYISSIWSFYISYLFYILT